MKKNFGNAVSKIRDVKEGFQKKAKAVIGDRRGISHFVEILIVVLVVIVVAIVVFLPGIRTVVGDAFQNIGDKIGDLLNFS